MKASHSSSPICFSYDKITSGDSSFPTRLLTFTCGTVAVPSYGRDWIAPMDDDQRRFFVRFGVSKANYSAPFTDRWFRRHDGGVLKPAVLERQRKSKGVPRGEA